MGIEIGTTYKLSDKAKRNAAIVAYKEANPEATTREIGKAFSLSHVRVAKILANKKSS